MSVRPRAWNSTLPARSEPMKSGGPIKPKKRKASEYRRIYGSRARVKAMKALGCAVSHCRLGPVHNAHLTNGGTGRKADWDTIVPLCASHHMQLDDVLGSVEAFDALYGTDLWATARRLAETLPPEGP